jgi:protocatechuate 3,4-dioxygenase beta subunit
MTLPDAVSEEMATMLSTCVVRRPWAEQDEGPYHRNAQPSRRDVREDRDGTDLKLGIRLIDEDGHQPGPETTVEIWQCDALGRYSGFPPPGPAPVTAAEAPRVEYLADQTFLRGAQRVDASGMVEFHTIYPGWYPGRTVHIHLMVHTAERILTSQIYFPDDLSEHILATAPYADRPGRDTTNATDTIFATGGEPALADITPAGTGYQAAICLVMPRLV